MIELAHAEAGVARRENIISNKQKLWKYFFGMFDRYEVIASKIGGFEGERSTHRPVCLQDFSRVMDRCTEQYGAIVLDNTSRSNKVEDCIFWYKANPDPPPYKMGKPIFWKLHNKFVKTEDDVKNEEKDRQNLERMNELSRRRRDPIVCIERQDESGNLIDDDVHLDS